jgi:16S rRNA (uracil1498-N3)-methyltransferase
MQRVPAASLFRADSIGREAGAGGGNRTPEASLENWSFTTKLRPHGARGSFALPVLRSSPQLRSADHSRAPNTLALPSAPATVVVAVNLILFHLAETNAPLPQRDPRAMHILHVLRRRVGDTVDVGLIDGPRGKATLITIKSNAIELAFTWGPPPSPLPSIVLLVGLPRPQTARDILRDGTSLGATAIHFIAAEKSERSYAQSALWSSGEWRRHLILGAEQAFDTRLPSVTPAAPLAEILTALPSATHRFALDNYESATALGKCHLLNDTFPVIAVGPERGWSAAEREALRAHGFVFAHLGARVLRTETAVVAALSIIRAKLGLM